MNYNILRCFIIYLYNEVSECQFIRTQEMSYRLYYHCIIKCFSGVTFKSRIVLIDIE